MGLVEPLEDEEQSPSCTTHPPQLKNPTTGASSSSYDHGHPVPIPSSSSYPASFSWSRSLPSPPSSATDDHNATNTNSDTNSDTITNTKKNPLTIVPTVSIECIGHTHHEDAHLFFLNAQTSDTVSLFSRHDQNGDGLDYRQDAKSRSHSVPLQLIASSDLKEMMDEVARESNLLRKWMANLAKASWSYYWIHFCLFSSISFMSGCLIYAAEYRRGVSFMDAYFISVSSMCVVGLATVDFSQFTISGQMVAFVTIILGGSVFGSALPQAVRCYYYHTYARMKNIDVKYFRYAAVLEFLSIEALLCLIPFYIVLFQLSSFLILTVYFVINPFARNILSTAGVNPVWFSLFHSVSAFNNSGLSLLSTSLVPFDKDPFVLFIHSVLIVAGNTGYPVFLRLLLWTVRKAMVKHPSVACDFLCKFPRQCFTHLFMRDETLVLLYLILGLTFGEALLSVIFDLSKLGRPETPIGFKLVVSLFQAVSTRTAGFQATELSDWNRGVLMVTIGAMYLSAYPLTVAIRSSNDTLDEFYENPNESSTPECGKALRKKRREAIQKEAQHLLFNDFTLIFVGMVLIQIIENQSIKDDPNFSSFKVIFEVISAYGTVGLSMGHPDVSYSFCGKFSTASKLVLIGIMLLGRHRGLPLSVDKALKVPVEQETTAPESDENAIPLRYKTQMKEQPCITEDLNAPHHKMSGTIFSTAVFELDRDAVIQRIQTTSNVHDLLTPYHSSSQTLNEVWTRRDILTPKKRHGLLTVSENLSF